MQPDRSPNRRLVLAVIVLILLTVGGGVFWLTHAVGVARGEAREWRAERGDVRFIGKTADEIIATFGTPYPWNAVLTGNPPSSCTSR